MKYFKKATVFAICALTLSVGMASVPNRAEADSDPYLGDIMIVGFNFCPRGWAEADGQLLSIATNTSLFSLLGTQFGGDGISNFGLPDLRSRIAIGQGHGPGLTSHPTGQKGGSEAKFMTQSTMPSHSHVVNANNLDGDKPGPSSKLLAAAPTGGTGNETIYSKEAPNRIMAAEMIGNTGGNGAINTQDPFLSLIHCIATDGVYPSRN